MNFENIFWPDSQLISIQIQYDHARLLIWSDVLQKQLRVDCYGLAGITNLCVWDDTIIVEAKIYPAHKANTEFMRNLYMAYDEDADYGGRFLKNGMQELRIELANGIAFSVYCQKIEVTESNV
jgi:hypothetical protein